MMPILQAEDAMATAERVAVGTGSLTKEAARSVCLAWRRDAERGSTSRHAPVTPQQLAAAGIGFQIVEPA